MKFTPIADFRLKHCIKGQKSENKLSEEEGDSKYSNRGLVKLSDHLLEFFFGQGFDP